MNKEALRILNELDTHGIQLSISETGMLTVKAPPGALTKEIKFIIQVNKTLLLDCIWTSEAMPRVREVIREFNDIAYTIDPDFDFCDKVTKIYRERNFEKFCGIINEWILHERKRVRNHLTSLREQTKDFTKEDLQRTKDLIETYTDRGMHPWKARQRAVWEIQYPNQPLAPKVINIGGN